MYIVSHLSLTDEKIKNLIIFVSNLEMKKEQALLDL
jgi:hypothetical protein